MAQTTITDLQNRSNLVINETQEGANNHQRVGTLFLDVVDTLNAAITTAQKVFICVGSTNTAFINIICLKKRLKH